MHRFKLIGLTLLAIFALSAVASATASAENPEILPTPTAGAPLNFTSTSGTGTFIGATTITCTSDTNTGSFTSARLGTVTVDFKECKSGAAKCNSEGDPAETILVDNAGIHLVDQKVAGVLTLLVAITLAKPVKITCSLIKLEVLGTVLGLVEGVKESTKTKTATMNFKTEPAKSKKQAQKKCELDKAFCEGKEFLLLSNIGKGNEESGEETIDKVTFEKEAEVHY